VCYVALSLIWDAMFVPYPTGSSQKLAMAFVVVIMLERAWRSLSNDRQSKPLPWRGCAINNSALLPSHGLRWHR
jgi:hypothetical protein